MVRRAASAAIACVVLAGCAPAIPLSSTPPKVDMPAGWVPGETARANEWPDKDWWNRFGSADLTRIVQEGQASNLELAAALARVRQAEAQARIAGVA
ncbi:MAG: transporter, partial [Pseudomonadota bacterium]|nr:transporter [Pseudomonadota bacterium]